MSTGDLRKKNTISDRDQDSPKAALEHPGGQKGSTIMILGGLLGTFWRSGGKSENGALACTGASKSRVGGTPKSMIFKFLLKAVPSTSPGATFGRILADFV